MRGQAGRLAAAATTLLTALVLLLSCNRLIPEDQNLSPANLYDQMKEWYLWSDTLPDLDPGNYASASEMLSDLKLDIDRWSRVIGANDFANIISNSSLVSNGFSWTPDDQDRVRVATVYEGSEASGAGIRRGWEVVRINGQAVTPGNMDELVGDSLGAVNDYEFQTAEGGSSEATITNTTFVPSAVMVSDTFAHEGDTVGYVVIDNLLSQAYEELKDLFTEYGENGVNILVIDLRYCRYGLTDISRYLANLVAGDVADKGPFVRYLFNDIKADKRNVTLRFEPLDEGLDLDSVYIITGPHTSGPAEVLINGLDAYITVHSVGSATDGAPIGIIGRQFQDSTLLPVTYKMSNRFDVTDFYNGLEPEIQVADDFDHELGDRDEACLKEVLSQIGIPGNKK